MIVGKFSFFDHDIYALVDPGSTHSYISTAIIHGKSSHVEELGQSILVTNPLGHSAIVNKVFKNCLIQIQNHIFPANLIELPFQDYDVILGMDWLYDHEGMVDCRKKRIIIKAPNEEEITVVGERSDFLSNVISATIAKRMIRKGCEAYLASVLEAKKEESNV